MTACVNDLAYVRRVLGLLAAADLRTWLFGGWGEELHGVIAPRPHKDIDLLCPAVDFASVDRFLAGGTVAEIAAKRFPHKRAFELDGVMTELFLVQQDAAGYYTYFWDQHRYDWPADVLDETQGLPVASVAALHGFRSKTRSLSPVVDGRAVTAEEWTRVHPDPSITRRT
ncbi:nucleotidyltransferase domain-containing protein [Flindersiella endophytica]